MDNKALTEQEMRIPTLKELWLKVPQGEAKKWRQTICEALEKSDFVLTNFIHGRTFPEKTQRDKIEEILNCKIDFTRGLINPNKALKTIRKK